MDSLTYCCSVLKQKLNTTSFQVWQHNDYTNKTTFICGAHDLDHPPTFPDYSLNRPTYKHKQRDDKSILFFLYPQGYQIAICTFGVANPFDKEDIEELFHLLRILILEKIIDKKNIELNTIIDSMHSITSISQLNNVLENIIKNALKVIPASDAGYLLLYDSSKDRLVTRVQVGFNEKVFKFQPKVGESITGSVFKDGKGRILNSRTALFKQMDTLNITKKNLNYITESAPLVEGAICVPISINEKRIGVIIIHQRTMKRRLTYHDLDLLEAFAGQAGIAIQNAQFHTETTMRLDEITTLSDQLKVRNKQLQQRYDIHERLMNISIKNRGINALISELEKMLNRPITFFNNLEHVFFTPHEKDNEQRLSIFEIKTMFSNQHLPLKVRIVDITNGEQSIYLHPLYTGGLFLGCFILHVDSGLSKSDRITLEQGGTALALELVNRKTNTNNHHQKMHEQFQSLISHDNPAKIIEHAKELGLDTSSYWMVALIEVPQLFNDVQYIDFDIYQLTSQIERELDLEEKVIYSFYNEVIILISLTDQTEADAVHNKLLSIKQTRDRNDSPIIRGGVSNAYQGIDHMKICYEEASKTLSYLANHDQIDIIQYDEIGLNRLFINQSPNEIDKFINEVFAPLRMDNERHQELEETLLTYIDCNRSAVKAAKQLHIHINTLYQRLKNIEQLLDVDLNNSEDNLEIQLACHLKSTRNMS